MRDLTFQRRMSLLALAAMLLLVLTPTLGRLMSSRDTSSDGIWAQMCTMTGLKLVKLAPANIDPTPPKPAGGDAPMQDCAYCPLLNALATLVVCVVLAFPQVTARLLPRRRVLSPRAQFHPCGLGSRGPPVAL